MSVCMDGRTLLTDDEYLCIIHALGLTSCGGRGRFGRRWAYRNYFAAGGKDVDVWRELERKGFAEQICEPRSLRPFHTFAVTKDGMKAADVISYVPRNERRD